MQRRSTNYNSNLQLFGTREITVAVIILQPGYLINAGHGARRYSLSCYDRNHRRNPKLSSAFNILLQRTHCNPSMVSSEHEMKDQWNTIVQQPSVCANSFLVFWGKLPTERSYYWIHAMHEDHRFQRCECMCPESDATATEFKWRVGGKRSLRMPVGYSGVPPG